MQNKDAIIEKLVEENKLLREHIKLLEEKIHSMEMYIAKLEEKIARLEKNSGNSSKPPSSDIVKPAKVLTHNKKKRKRGGQHGHRKFSRPTFKPQEVDEVIEYEFTDKDAAGLKPLDEWFVIQQIQLPEKMYKVIEHRARKYID